MNKQWYYDKAGAQVGPVTEQNLKQMVLDGTVEKETFIWSEGMTDWCGAEQAAPHIFTSSPFKVADAYRASTVSQPVIRGGSLFHDSHAGSIFI